MNNLELKTSIPTTQFTGQAPSGAKVEAGLRGWARPGPASVFLGRRQAASPVVRRTLEATRKASGPRDWALRVCGKQRPVPREDRPLKHATQVSQGQVTSLVLGSLAGSLQRTTKQPPFSYSWVHLCSQEEGDLPRPVFFCERSSPCPRSCTGFWDRPSTLLIFVLILSSTLRSTSR